MQAAHVPDTVAFATKPTLAAMMIDRTVHSLGRSVHSQRLIAQREPGREYQVLNFGQTIDQKRPSSSYRSPSIVAFSTQTILSAANGVMSCCRFDGH